MKKKLSVIILIVGILSFAFAYAHIDKNTYLYDRNTDSTELIGTGILKEKEEVRQSFICREDSIEGINLKVTVIGNPEDVELMYSLVDAESNDVLCEEVVQGTEIKNNKFNKLKFPVLKETRGRRYILSVSESGNSSEAGISIYVSPEDGQEQLTIRGEKAQGVLAVRILTHRFDLETFIVLLGIALFIAGFLSVLYKLFY